MKKQTHNNILMTVLVISLVINTILINITPPIIEELVFVGFILLGTGIFLFILSVVTLRSKHTDHVVDSGIYGIVRHPMYLGGMIMFFSHIFLGQHWIVLVSTAVAIGCCYGAMRSGDQRNIEKFGADYIRYMKKVPRMNIALGLTRHTHRVK